MEYEFSIGAFFFGIITLAVGAAFLKWHQVVADNMGGGVSSYERYKLWALIVCGVGVLVMLNLHVTILGWVFNMIFNRG